MEPKTVILSVSAFFLSMKRDIRVITKYKDPHHLTAMCAAHNEYVYDITLSLPPISRETGPYFLPMTKSLAFFLLENAF